jgi:hypothetical protein
VPETLACASRTAEYEDEQTRRRRVLPTTVISSDIDPGERVLGSCAGCAAGNDGASNGGHLHTQGREGLAPSDDLSCARSGAPEVCRFPRDAGTYPTLCCRCHAMVMLSPADAIVAEARAVIGDLTIVLLSAAAASVPVR